MAASAWQEEFRKPYHPPRSPRANDPKLQDPIYKQTVRLYTKRSPRKRPEISPEALANLSKPKPSHCTPKYKGPDEEQYPNWEASVTGKLPQPKNVERLIAMAQPRERLATEKYHSPGPHRYLGQDDVPQPKNLDNLIAMAKPKERQMNHKYVPPGPAQYPAADASRAGRVKMPANVDRLMDMAKQKPRFASTKFKPKQPKEYLSASTNPRPANEAYLMTLSKNSRHTRGK